MSKASAGQVRQSKQEWMRLELPYGLWICEDGRQVFFNRWYKPIWTKLPDGRVEAASPREWIKYAKQEWFYKDGNPPWSSKASLKVCEGKLAEWGIPAPDPKRIRYKPRDVPGLYRGEPADGAPLRDASRTEPATKQSLDAQLDRIIGGLAVPPAAVEQILRRVGLVCRARQQDRARRLADEDCDAQWVSGYAGGWGDSADLFGHLADVLADRGRR